MTRWGFNFVLFSLLSQRMNLWTMVLLSSHKRNHMCSKFYTIWLFCSWTMCTWTMCCSSERYGGDCTYMNINFLKETAHVPAQVIVALGPTLSVGDALLWRLIYLQDLPEHWDFLYLYPDEDDEDGLERLYQSGRKHIYLSATVLCLLSDEYEISVKLKCLRKHNEWEV